MSNKTRNHLQYLEMRLVEDRLKELERSGGIASETIDGTKFARYGIGWDDEEVAQSLVRHGKLKACTRHNVANIREQFYGVLRATSKAQPESLTAEQAALLWESFVAAVGPLKSINQLSQLELCVELTVRTMAHPEIYQKLTETDKEFCRTASFQWRKHVMYEHVLPRYRSLLAYFRHEVSGNKNAAAT